MRKEYTRPELNISEYIIEEVITASSFFGGANFDATNDVEAKWEDFE